MMDVAAWRREKRAELYAARKAMTAEQRHDAARKIAGGLDDHCARHKPALVGLYWPIKYEPNLLSWARARARRLAVLLAGGRLAWTTSRILALDARRPDAVRCLGHTGSGAPGRCDTRPDDRTAARL